MEFKFNISIRKRSCNKIKTTNNIINNKTNYINKYITFDKYSELHIYYKNEFKGIVIIDTEDIEKIKNYIWSINNNNYVVNYKNKKVLLLHRLVMNVHNIEFNAKTNTIDHINNNTLDNRKCNLRICSASNNIHNRKDLKNKPHNGVYYSKSNKKWTATIKIAGKRYYLGTYINIENAIKARKDAEIKFNITI